MNKENVKITLGAAILLDDVINNLLYEKDPKDPSKVSNRKLPFRLSYRLNRNKAALDKDIERFNGHKMYLFAKHGKLSEDGKNVNIESKEEYDLYKKEIAALLDSPITHNVMTLEEEDIDLVTANIDTTPEVMQLFIKYMMADQELLDDLTQKVNLNLPDFKENN